MTAEPIDNMFDDLGSVPASAPINPKVKVSPILERALAKDTETVAAASVSTQSAADAAFDRAYEKIMAMMPNEIGETGKLLFPDDRYQRVAFHCWVQTVQDRNKRHRNPKSKPVNFIGEPGEGKSARVYSFGDVMQDWISELAGEFVEFRTVVRTLAAVNDFSEILGVQHIDEKTQTTRIFPDEWLPCGKKTKVFGVLFVDDGNRGDDRTMAAAMELANAMQYNSFVLPDSFATFWACNPAGKGHKVKSTDKAQNTRFVPLVVASSFDSFLQELARQGVSSTMLGHAVRFGKELLPNQPVHGILPEPRVLNKRNYTMLCHLYESLQYDEEALTEVGYAMLGTNNLKDIKALLSGDLPLDPEEIIGVNARDQKQGKTGSTPKAAWTLAEPKVKSFRASNKQDLLSVMTYRLVAYLNDPKFSIADDQLEIIAEYFMSLPKDLCAAGLRKLILQNAPRGDYYRPKLHGIRSNGRQVGEFGQYVAEVLRGARTLVDTEMAADED